MYEFTDTAELGTVEMDADLWYHEVSGTASMTNIDDPGMSFIVHLELDNLVGEPGKVTLWMLEQHWNDDLLIQPAVWMDEVEVPADGAIDVDLFAYDEMYDEVDETFHLLLSLSGDAVLSGTGTLTAVASTLDEQPEGARADLTLD